MSKEISYKCRTHKDQRALNGFIEKKGNNKKTKLEENENGL